MKRLCVGGGSHGIWIDVPDDCTQTYNVADPRKPRTIRREVEVDLSEMTFSYTSYKLTWFYNTSGRQINALVDHRLSSRQAIELLEQILNRRY